MNQDFKYHFSIGTDPWANRNVIISVPDVSTPLCQQVWVWLGEERELKERKKRAGGERGEGKEGDGDKGVEEVGKEGGGRGGGGTHQQKERR